MKPETTHNTEQLMLENRALRQQIDELNQEHPAWLHSIFYRNSEAIAVCEKFSSFPTTIIDCNEEFARTIGESSNQLIGRDFMELLGKGEKRKFFVQSFSNVSDKSTNNFPLLFINNKQEEREIEVTTQTIKSNRQELIIITLHLFDTKQNRIQNGIEEVFSYCNQLFLCVKDDEILPFDYVSQSAHKITGYSSQQLLLNPFLFWNNCHPNDINKLKDLIAQPHQYQNELKIRFVRKDKQMIWLSFTIIKNIISSNNETAYYIYATDVTSDQRNKRITDKKDIHNQFIIKNAELLICEPFEKALEEILYSLHQIIKSDRLSIYISYNNTTIIDSNAFKSNVKTEDKTYQPSNLSIWKTYRFTFETKPVVLYQRENETYILQKKQLSFFTDKQLSSAMLIPIRIDNITYGFISTSNITKAKHWDRADINFLSNMSNLIGRAMLKHAKKQQIEA